MTKIKQYQDELESLVYAVERAEAELEEFTDEIFQLCTCSAETKFTEDHKKSCKFYKIAHDLY